MPRDDIRIALVGAGYIAQWHADAIKATPGARVSVVCDTAPDAAASLAGLLDVPARMRLEDLFAEDLCDAVHVLTPPGAHREIALAALAAGRHVLVEKPVALRSADVREMANAADRAGKVLASGHNFLGTPSYQRLKAAVSSGALGRVSAAEIAWRYPLPPLRSGPFGLWMLRAPENLLLELGPHLFAFAVDLFGPVEDITLRLGKPVEVPGAGPRHQSWRILARAGHVDLTFTLSLVETFDDRSVTVIGSSGIARLDYGAGALRIARENAADIIFNPFLRQSSAAWQEMREGVRNAVVQGLSLNRKSPYALGFQGTVGAFVEAIQAGKPMDPRFSGASAAHVMEGIEGALAALPPAPQATAASAAVAHDAASVPIAHDAASPKVLVIGGTGFLGRYLVRALAASGHQVRVLSRGQRGPFTDLGPRVELLSASLKDADAIAAAMEGCAAVYHLAKADEKTWDAYLENDVKVTERVAEAALAQGIARVIYTGTIASYDMSRMGEVITEETPFGDLSQRNLYARSKAACESLLTEMHRARGLPLVIARPGIVVGREGPLQHWGIGRWSGAAAVRMWNHGRNRLPFVLVEDVADALVAMRTTEAALGQSFNLVGDPMVSARDYFAAIARLSGADIKVRPGSAATLYAAAEVKYALKRFVLRQKGLDRASYRDWKSRAHLARFDNAHAKRVLGWQPEADRERFLERAIVEARLFGF